MITAAKSVFGQRTKNKNSSEASSSITSITADVKSSGGTPFPQSAADTERKPIHLDSQATEIETGPSLDLIATKLASSGSHEVGDSDTAAPVSQATRAMSELYRAIDEFEKHYKQFSRRYIVIEEDLESVFQSPQKRELGDLKATAKIFGDNVVMTIKTVEKKQDITQSKWTTQVGLFLTKLYPLARLGCGLMGSVAEVLPP